jgi:hypothetical protein
MLAVARVRIAGDPRAELICATAEIARLTRPVDAILFSYTHDVLRSTAALENLLGQAKPGARVAATSTKLYARWLVPANWYLRATHRGYITNFEGFEAPGRASRLCSRTSACTPDPSHSTTSPRDGCARRAESQRAKKTW